MPTVGITAEADEKLEAICDQYTFDPSKKAIASEAIARLYEQELGTDPDTPSP